jgi:hypothetical protein
MSLLNVDTVEPEGATTDLTLGAGGDKVVIPGTIKISGGSPGADKLLTSDADGDATWETAASSTNTPSFGAYLAANQTFTDDSWEKITMNTEEWNIGGGFSTANNRFTVPSGEAGKYFFSATTTATDSVGGQEMGTIRIAVYKKPALGSNAAFKQAWFDGSGARHEWRCESITCVLDLGVDDEIEFHAYMESGNSPTALGGQSMTFCTGFKLL